MARRILAKYDSECLSCHEEVEAGDVVWWEPDIGVWHEECPTPDHLLEDDDDDLNEGTWYH